MFLIKCIPIFLSSRLWLVRKLSETYAWVLCSLQLTKLLDYCDMWIQPPQEPSQPWWNTYSTLATLIVTLTLTKILLLESSHPLSLRKVYFFSIS